MRYEVELPHDIDQRLSERASETGQEVVHLIRIAVTQFVEQDFDPLSITRWSDEVEIRRRELIDRDIAGAITPAERVELVHLDRLANKHFDEIAPPPMEGARRLHEQLLHRRGS
jgi:hypothetical protein